METEVHFFSHLNHRDLHCKLQKNLRIRAFSFCLMSSALNELRRKCQFSTQSRHDILYLFYQVEGNAGVAKVKELVDGRVVSNRQVKNLNRGPNRKR